jgi:hypothetical protein
MDYRVFGMSGDPVYEVYLTLVARHLRFWAGLRIAGGGVWPSLTESCLSLYRVKYSIVFGEDLMSMPVCC